MKKHIWIWYILSVLLCAAGIMWEDRLGKLDIVFILLGIGLLLFTVVRHCVGMAPRCPNCNAVIPAGHKRTMARQIDGVVPCESCGTLVRIRYS